MNSCVPSGSTTPPTRWGRRHTVLALCVSAVFVGYTDRVNIAVAAVAMRQQFGWSQTTKGLVLSAFAVGYLLSMALSGFLATRFGGKRVMLVAVLWWSAFTLLTPWSAYQSTAMLVAARVGLGMGEAAVFPASYDLFSRWVLPTERTRAISALYSGVSLGQIAGLLGTAWVTSRFGWPAAFYICAMLGFLWASLWFTQVSDNPRTDPRVAPSEWAAMRRDAPLMSVASASAEQVPWGRLLAHPPIWAIVVGNFCSNWGLYFFLAWLPSYFAEPLKLNLANAGIFSAAPWLTAMATAVGSALASDRAIAHGIPAILVRKITLCGGLVLSALFLGVMRNVHSPVAALLCVSAAAGALGMTWSGYGPNLLDVTPRYASVVAGISNTVATIPGVAGVALVGWLVDVTGNYSAAFALTASVCFGGAVFYFIFGSAKQLEI